jgi:hypothetical protein
MLPSDYRSSVIQSEGRHSIALGAPLPKKLKTATFKKENKPRPSSIINESKDYFEIDSALNIENLNESKRCNSV